jgi:hypothetical protein
MLRPMPSHLLDEELSFDLVTTHGMLIPVQHYAFNFIFQLTINQRRRWRCVDRSIRSVCIKPGHMKDVMNLHAGRQVKLILAT